MLTGEPGAMPDRVAQVVPGAGIEPARGFPQGIFLPLLLSPLHAEAMHLWSGLYLCHPVALVAQNGLGRGRQVSTLSLGAAMPGHSPEQLKDAVGQAPNQGLARYCSHRDVLLFHRL